MKNSTNNKLSRMNELLATVSTPLNETSGLDPLLELIGDSKYVLLGEASHGTHEYYTWRAKISKRLIEEKGFSFIAVEGDWPDCYRLNRYIKNYQNSGKSSLEVLSEFKRWPTWMWANWEMVAFADWLKKFNLNLSAEKKVGFYGLDVYSLWESLEAILDYLKKNDPLAAQSAMNVIKCFQPYKDKEGQSYALATRLVSETCEPEVINLLNEIQRNIARYNSDYENVFSAEQNALIAVNAEKYYRAMVRGGAESWNIRDKHMSTTLDRLMNLHGKKAKVIVWEHNTHIGDARATDMVHDGMLNVGQLVKEKHLNDGVISVGFGSYKGSVIAGREWGDVMRKINVPAAKEGSWENILHENGTEKNKLIMLHKLRNEDRMDIHIGHRAIGVVYQPEFEQYGNYVPSILPMRYDAFIFLDETNALNPLHIIPNGHQIPETYPFGF